MLDFLQRNFLFVLVLGGVLLMANLLMPIVFENLPEVESTFICPYRQISSWGVYFSTIIAVAGIREAVYRERSIISYLTAFVAVTVVDPVLSKFFSI